MLPTVQSQSFPQQEKSDTQGRYVAPLSRHGIYNNYRIGEVHHDPQPTQTHPRSPTTAYARADSGYTGRGCSGAYGGTSQEGVAVPEKGQVQAPVSIGNQPPNVSSSASLGPESWSLSIERIFEDGGLRLDASYHNPSAAAAAIQQLKDSGLELRRLDSLAEVRLPGRFERIWARDERHGLPYLNATDLLSLFSSGSPSKEMRYLSWASDVNIDALIIQTGMLLITCSGTIGRVYYVPERLSGWAATHDLFRVIPASGLSGYLYAWCSSPIARVQILNPTYGAQIDHITDKQLGGILVPMPPPNKVEEINRSVLNALAERERGLVSAMNAWKQIV